jgi:biotin carboxyl carrier protein
VTFEIEAASRTRAIRIAHVQGRYEVTVDGRPRPVDAVRVGSAAWSLLIGPAEAGHYAGRADAAPSGSRSYEAGVVDRAAGELTVYVNGRAVPVRVGGGARRRRRAGPLGDAGTGPQAVAAPMPGRVVKVLVKAGDAVQARQGLVVVEAMKMENELRAARAGIVTDVRVAEGASVEAGAVLVVIA